MVPISPFGKCVVALEPVKPALWLAGEIKCTERAANRYISGARKIPGRALVALMNAVA